MPKRYKEARLMHKAKLTEMATKLGVSQPTLWCIFKKGDNNILICTIHFLSVQIFRHICKFPCGICLQVEAGYNLSSHHSAKLCSYAYRICTHIQAYHAPFQTNPYLCSPPYQCVCSFNSLRNLLNSLSSASFRALIASSIL